MRQVLRLRGTIPQTADWDVMCDLYFYRDQEEIEKDEQIAQEKEQAKDLEPIEAAPQAPDWGAQEVGSSIANLPQYTILCR